jgi:adenylate cyclase
VERFKRIRVCIGTGATIALVIYLLSQTILYYPFLLVQSLVDDSHFARQFRRSEASAAVDDRIVIVDIDNTSLRRLGTQWRLWPRRYFAEVIGALNRDGADLIFLDILFTEGGRRSENQAFSDSVLAAGNVVSGYYVNLDRQSRYRRPDSSVRHEYFLSRPNETIADRIDFLESDRVTFSYRELVRASVELGYANYQPDFDGVLRHVPIFLEYQQWTIPSASLQLLLRLEGEHYSAARITPDAVVVGDTRIPTDRHAFMRINYTGLKNAYRWISFADVLHGAVPPGTFDGKIVMIGSSSERLGDIKRIPGDRFIPGVEVHAAALSTMLTENYLSTLPDNVFFFLNLLLGALAAALFRYTKPLRGGLLAVVLTPLVLYTAAMVCFSRFNILLNTTTPTVIILATYLFVAFYLYCKRNMAGECVLETDS